LRVDPDVVAFTPKPEHMPLMAVAAASNDQVGLARPEGSGTSYQPW
jgi:hypothetical protein